MTLPQAVKVAIESMRAEVQRLAFDANLCDRLGLKEPVTLRASKQRRRLLDAIATLSEMGEGMGHNVAGRLERASSSTPANTPPHDVHPQQHR